VNGWQENSKKRKEKKKSCVIAVEQIIISTAMRFCMKIFSVIISPTMRFCTKISSVKISPAYVSFWTRTKYGLAWHFLDKESAVELNYNQSPFPMHSLKGKEMSTIEFSTSVLHVCVFVLFVGQLDN
jgi:hypothetical protein